MSSFLKVFKNSSTPVQHSLGWSLYVLPDQAALSLPVDGWGRGGVEARWPWHPHSCLSQSALPVWLAGGPLPVPVLERAGASAACETQRWVLGMLSLSFTLPWKWQCSLKVGGMKAWLSYSFSFKSFPRRPGFCTSSVSKLTIQPSSVLSSMMAPAALNVPLWHQPWERRDLYHCSHSPISLTIHCGILIWVFSQAVLEPMWVLQRNRTNSVYIMRFIKRNWLTWVWWPRSPTTCHLQAGPRRAGGGNSSSSSKAWEQERWCESHSKGKRLTDVSALAEGEGKLSLPPPFCSVRALDRVDDAHPTGEGHLRYSVHHCKC